MKKLLLIIAIVVGMVGYAAARDNYSHDASVLPQAAKTTIANNFKGKVSLVKTEKEFGSVKEYEVILTDGTEITFDKNGNWKDVEVNISKSVPSSIVPKAITDYVKKNQKNQRIVGLEKDRGGYEVELSNGVEMKFDTAGNFLKFDK